MGVRAFGGRERLESLDLSVDDPADDETVIRMEAAGVGEWDRSIREGCWDVQRPLPLALGLEAAGVVERVGHAGTAFVPGQEVLTYCWPLRHTGAWAEYITVAATSVAPRPPGLGPLQAAALPVPGLIAHQVLHDALQIGDGQRVLVTRAAGSVGHLAVQVAARAGAEVVATCSTTHAEAVRGLGAREVYNDQNPSWALQIALDGGVDAALSTEWGGTATAAMSAVRDGGRLATITGNPPEPQRGIAVVNAKSNADADGLADLARAVADGWLQVHLDSVYPLEQAADAAERVETGQVHGRVVLDIGDVNDVHDAADSRRVPSTGSAS